MTSSNLPATREFIAERDFLIFNMRKEGEEHAAIAKKFGISTRAVGEAIKRQLARLNREALASYPEVLGMELARLDALQESVWPMTRVRTETMPDGSEIVLSPDLRAVDSALKIMSQRARLLGIDAQKVDVKVSGETEVRHTLHGVSGKGGSKSIDYKEESRNMLELMMSAGIIKEEFGKKLLDELDGVIEGTVVEEGEESGEETDGSL